MEIIMKIGMPRRAKALGIMITLMLFIGRSAVAQESKVLPAIIVNGDTIPVIWLRDVWVFDKGNAQSIAERARYSKLIRNVLKVYPLAKEAAKRMSFVESELKKISDPKIQEYYTNMYEKHLKKEFTPVLKQLTYSQGKILIKLIDRETSETSYALVKRFRGNFEAFIWQSFASLFGISLKTQYDPEGTDQEIEDIVKAIESGKYK